MLHKAPRLPGGHVRHPQLQRLARRVAVATGAAGRVGKRSQGRGMWLCPGREGGVGGHVRRWQVSWSCGHAALPGRLHHMACQCAATCGWVSQTGAGIDSHHPGHTPAQRKGDGLAVGTPRHIVDLGQVGAGSVRVGPRVGMER